MHISAEINAITHKGLERDHNEDYHIYSYDLGTKEWTFYEHRPPQGESKNGILLAVADGMGGLNAGEVASKLAIEGIQEFFDGLDDSKIKTLHADPKKTLIQSILFAHQKIVNFQKDNPETRGMGTTLVLCLITGDMAYAAWSGDSRCYKFNSQEGLVRISRDHSLVQQLVEEKKITADQAFYHPDSNIILQNLGDPKLKPAPEVIAFNVEIDDRILLCSDGLCGMIEDRHIEDILKNNADISNCSTILVDAANNAGGHDNITLILCDIKDRKASEEPLPLSLSLPVPETVTKRKTKPFLLILLLVVIVAMVVVFVNWNKFFKASPEAASVPDTTITISTEVKDTSQIVQQIPVTNAPKPEETEAPVKTPALPEKTPISHIDSLYNDLKNLEKNYNRLLIEVSGSQAFNTHFKEILELAESLKKQPKLSSQDSMNICSGIQTFVSDFKYTNDKTGSTIKIKKYEAIFCKSN